MLTRATSVAPVFLLLLAMGCLWQTTAHAQAEGRAPVILNAYAPKVIRPGATWDVYLEGEDPDGDMKYIVAELWQAGVGYYPVDFTLVKEGARRKFAGYLFLSTPYDPFLFGNELTLRLLLRDEKGNRSELITLPLTFDLVPRQEVPEEWKAAAEHRLGAIMINISSSQRYNRGGQ